MKTDAIEEFEIKNLYAGYGKKQVINGANLRIEPGKCTIVAGSNGCGKSTLFSVMAGIKSKKNGEILFMGENCSSGALSGLTGYIPQDSPLFGDLTVYDNLLLWYKSKSKVEEALQTQDLKELGIQDMLKKDVNTLSGGMQRRVCIACALAGTPKLLIMDEPGAALDLECKIALHGIIRRFMERGGSVLMSSHEEMDLELANHLFIMRGGQLFEYSTDYRGEKLLELFKHHVEEMNS